MSSNLLIVGASGHGKMVADAAVAMGQWERVRFIDDGSADTLVLDLHVHPSSVLDQEVFSPVHNQVVIAIADNQKRLRAQQYYIDLGYEIATVIHPRAVVSDSALIAPGTVVLPCAVVAAQAQVSTACIINSGAVIEHDCVLSEGVHLSPNVGLGGRAQVGRLSWLGVGSSVIQGVHIGEEVMVGAGAVVINDIDDRQTVVGVPATSLGLPKT